MSKKTFNIDNVLYPLPLLERARDDFSDFDITLASGIVTIVDEDPQYVFDEFVNYTLSLISETLGA